MSESHQFTTAGSKADTIFSEALLTYLGYTCFALRPNIPDHYQFGWYWENEGDVDRRVRDLIIRNRSFNVWNTHQFKAVERLIGVEKLPFPPHFDEALYGTFIRIVEMEIFCRNPGLNSDLIDADDRIERANRLYAEAADILYGIRPEVHELVGPILASLGFDPYELANTQAAHTRERGIWSGVIKSEIEKRKKLRERYFGAQKNKAEGRTSNWVAEYITVQAADIYRTTFSGEIKRNCPGASRPSFAGFLKDFSKGYPEAERADHRSLARKVWNGEYGGKPFAPI